MLTYDEIKLAVMDLLPTVGDRYFDCDYWRKGTVTKLGWLCRQATKEHPDLDVAVHFTFDEIDCAGGRNEPPIKIVGIAYSTRLWWDKLSRRRVLQI